MPAGAARRGARVVAPRGPATRRRSRRDPRTRGRGPRVSAGPSRPRTRGHVSCEPVSGSASGNADATGTPVESPRVRETRRRAQRAQMLGGAVAARHHLRRASHCDGVMIGVSVKLYSRASSRYVKIRWISRAAIVARAWRFHARGGDAEGRVSDGFAAGGAHISPGAGAQVAALPHALGSPSHIQRLLGFGSGPVGRARERDAAGRARLRGARRKRPARSSAPKRAPPNSRRGMASAARPRLVWGSTSTETRSSCPTRTTTRARSATPRWNARWSAAASQATHPDAAYETFRASVRKSSLKLRSARGSRRAEGRQSARPTRRTRPRGGSVERRESFAAPRVVSGAAARAARGHRRVRTQLRGSRTTEKRAVERDPRRDARTRPHVSNVLDPAREASETPSETAGRRTAPTARRRSTSLATSKSSPTRTATDYTDYTDRGGRGRKEKEEDEEEEEEKRVVLPRGVFHTTLRDARRAGRSRRRSPSRGARLSTPPPRTRASFESVSIRDRRSARRSSGVGRRTGRGSRSTFQRPTSRRFSARACESRTRALVQNRVLPRRVGRLFVRRSPTAPATDARRRRVGAARRASRAHRRLERERDASVAASAEKTDRREERARERERTRKETRIAEHDATTNGENDVVFDDERGFGGARKTKALRTTLRSAATRAFGVSAFLAMAAALLLARGHLTLSTPRRPYARRAVAGFYEVDRYWERETGPVGRARRSALFSAPKELFAKAVAGVKNALVGAWVSGHARETENVAFDVFDDPVPAPS